jgi:hypothetical protein
MARKDFFAASRHESFKSCTVCLYTVAFILPNTDLSPTNGCETPPKAAKFQLYEFGNVNNWIDAV